MTYPAIGSVVKTTEQFREMDRLQRRTRNMTQAMRNASVSQNISRKDILKFRANLLELAAAVSAYAALGQDAMDVARRELRDGTLSASDITTPGTHATALADWIQTAIPDGSAGTTYDQASGAYTDAYFSPAQLSTFRTHCDTLLADYS